ncbi:helix-turn-helix domain-containing protein [Clostridium perfringens]|uniref:helix-turn-helix domain-containing protein n=1 Tax=Clostridium perfringens TaxID=1502 RepID=UPI0024693386|nr:helix-turn-helix transcriptional regulator [Clostridium perfringens]MDH5085207.1 hypothetical protein [Clostridium perfringens]
MILDLNKLRLVQAEQCLSINEIVCKTGLSKATVWRTINGKTKATPKTIGLIAKALKVDVTEIIK